MLSRTLIRPTQTVGRRFASTSATASTKKAAEKDVTEEVVRGVKLYAASAFVWYTGWVSYDAYTEHQHFIAKKGRRSNGEFYDMRSNEPYYYASHGWRCHATTPLEAALHGAKRQQEVHAFQGIFWPVVTASRAFTSAVGYATDALAPETVTE